MSWTSGYYLFYDYNGMWLRYSELYLQRYIQTEYIQTEYHVYILTDTTMVNNKYYL